MARKYNEGHQEGIALYIGGEDRERGDIETELKWGGDPEGGSHIPGKATICVEQEGCFCNSWVMGMGKKEIQAGIVKAAYLSAGRAGSGRPLHTALMPTAVARQPATQA